jgi:Asp-tRNA(Asn)/Glu-tRNA(Gln) amidotransferase A subunit family amidase
MSVSAFCNVSTQAAGLEQRAVSSVELVDPAIARIEALDDQINAVVVRDFDRARQITFLDQLVWPGVATSGGLPATVVPIDRTSNGPPLGMQIMGAQSRIAPPSASPDSSSASPVVSRRRHLRANSLPAVFGRLPCSTL